jgi:nucleotide-binding universal stress UspA family protein
MYHRLLVAHDGSESAARALDQAIDLASSLGAELHSITVDEGIPIYFSNPSVQELARREQSRYVREIEAEATARAQARGVTLHPDITSGGPVYAIAGYVREHDIDLLLLGFHAHSHVLERIFGSTTGSLVADSPCSVLIVK